MFLDFFYLLRLYGLKVSVTEWILLMEALQKGLCTGLTQFYDTSRAILIKSEADFDQFDLLFAKYFEKIRSVKEIPQELMDWLNDQKPQKAYKKEEIDRLWGNLDLKQIQKMLEERLAEQKERHDGGSYWLGTGGTSVFGNTGYNPVGIRVGGDSQNRRAMQIASRRKFKDFREDDTLDQRQFQMAFRRLRQLTREKEGPRDVLDLDRTIEETGNQAGLLKLVYERPRKNTVKLLLLIDSGGSMWFHAKLCNSLFQAAKRSNHWKDLQIFYFHNCFYERLYTTPACRESESIASKWVLQNFNNDYKVIVVGDAAMAMSELIYKGGRSWYYEPNEESGITWIRRFRRQYKSMIWMNPIPKRQWEDGWGSRTIDFIRQTVPMYPLTIGGLEDGLYSLLGTRQTSSTSAPSFRNF